MTSQLYDKPNAIGSVVQLEFLVIPVYYCVAMSDDESF
jgi:hypothetical protein